MLNDLERVKVYIDDILLAKKEDQPTLQVLLQRLRKNGVKFNKGKCKFRQHKVNYLGHRIDEHGLHPKDGNLEAISKAPLPRNVSELRCYLGLITYCINSCTR